MNLDLLEWYYSLIFESEESGAFVEVAHNALEVIDPPGKRSVSSKPSHQDLVDRSWRTFNRVVDDSISAVDLLSIGPYMPHTRAAQTIAGAITGTFSWWARATGLDDYAVRKAKSEHPAFR